MKDSRRFLDNRVLSNEPGLCRWCRSPVKPPRRSWCSQGCVDAYLVRSSSGAARGAVFRRDNGVCSLCGLDTVALESELRVWLASIVVCRPSQSGESIEALLSHDGRTFSVGSFSAPKANCIWGRQEEKIRSQAVLFAERHARQRLRAFGRLCECPWHVRVAPLRYRLGGHLWEADHVVPVVEGGGRCGLENLRTLCLACHGKETAALAARRAALRRMDAELRQ